jgi:hypothetical protein
MTVKIHILNQVPEVISELNCLSKTIQTVEWLKKYSGAQ